MTCFVTGFPSKIAALQFEWAWQNTHLTRHVSPNSRLTHQAKTTIRISPKTGRPRKRSARPRLSLTDRLANLHLLLKATSFERWPLSVRFYAEDVYRVWQKWTAQEASEPLRRGIDVSFEGLNVTSAAIGDNARDELPAGIQALGVGYSALKPHLEKTQRLLAISPQCTVCHEQLPKGGDMTLVCPNAGCDAAAHLECLASNFLHSDANELIPTTGSCLSCGTQLQWSALVKELSLRMRGAEEVDKIFKVRKPRGKKQQNDASEVVPTNDEQPEEDEEMDDPLPLEDEWHELVESDENVEEEREFGSDPSPLSRGTKQYTSAFETNSEPLIEDSEWDDAEVVF